MKMDKSDSVPDIFQRCLYFTRLLLYPSFYCFIHFWSLFHIVYQEKDQVVLHFLKKVILGPIYIAIFLLFLPLMITFLPLRCLLLLRRNKQPYTFQVKHTDYTLQETEIQNEFIENGQHKFGIATANICLLTEPLSRFNHLKDVDGRSRKIGEAIVASQFFNDEWVRNFVYRENKRKAALYTSEINGYVEDKKPFKQSSVEGDVSARFNRLDFLIIQEAFSSYHNQGLIKELEKVFPYIVHDTAIHSLSVNRFCLGSGLLIASRHPIAEIEFQPFENFIDHASLIACGLLCVKVLLGDVNSRKRKVGYLFNLHFQAYQGTTPVIYKQMDEVLEISQQFMSRTVESEDRVMFSFICGDFNCDNMSPCDTDTAKHKIFQMYEDYAREKPGKDKPWSIGTEFRQYYMMEPQVSFPEGLKKALDDPILRQRYVIDADVTAHTKEILVDGQPKFDAHGNLSENPLGGKRRIDHIVFHKDYPVQVEGYHFVTQLTTLTDHIPVAMEFSLPS